MLEVVHFNMANGREVFFIKYNNEKKKTFPSLTFLAARFVYYLNVNCMYNIRKAQINPFYCLCDDYSGCPFPNGLRNYCDVCYLFSKHDVEDNEKAFSNKHLIDKNIELMADFKKFNVQIDNNDYIFKFRNGNDVSFYEIIFSNETSIKFDTFYW